MTGASGFIGKYLVAELLDAGWRVVAGVHNERGAKSLASWCSGAKVVVCSMDDWRLLAEMAAEESPEVFFHLAWGGYAARGPEGTDTQLASVVGSVAALRCAHAVGCSRFVGAGSIHEIEGLVDLGRETPSGTPMNKYKAAKLAAHHLCKVEASELDIDFLWPKITNAYGPGEVSSRLVNTMIRKLLTGESPDLTDGRQPYTFVYATDVVRALRLIAERGRPFADYVIGAEEVAPLRTWLERVGAVVAPDVELGFGRMAGGVCLAQTELYTESLFSDTGFRTEVSFEEGIRRTAEWMRESIVKEA